MAQSNEGIEKADATALAIAGFSALYIGAVFLCPALLGAGLLGKGIGMLTASSVYGAARASGVVQKDESSDPA